MRPKTTELLDQTEVWYDGTDECFTLTEMEDEHLVNLRGWLLRNAPRLHNAALFEMHHAAGQMHGEVSQSIMDLAITILQVQNPHVWMEERPLFQMIDRIIYERRGYVYVTIPEEASSH